MFCDRHSRYVINMDSERSTIPFATRHVPPTDNFGRNITTDRCSIYLLVELSKTLCITFCPP